MAIDTSLFRQVAGRFATGVTVITTGEGGRFHGMTANAFATVSLSPMLVLVCVDKTAHTYPVLHQSQVFAVNILSEKQEALARVFADKDSQDSHNLNGVSYHFGRTGVPLLDGCTAYLECRVVNQHGGGDHTIFVGEVEDAVLGEDDRPLLYYRSGYGTVDH